MHFLFMFVILTENYIDHYLEYQQFNLKNLCAICQYKTQKKNSPDCSLGYSFFFFLIYSKSFEIFRHYS